jgi:hypothetical protein
MEERNELRKEDKDVSVRNLNCGDDSASLMIDTQEPSSTNITSLLVVCGATGALLGVVAYG